MVSCDWLFNSSPAFYTLLLSLYAQHLASGNTLVCRELKAGTVKLYVRQVSSFLQLFPPSPYDYRFDSRLSTTYTPPLKAVFDEIQRLETIPNRREPYTTEMHLAFRRIVESSILPRDGRLHALLDWFEIGLFLGCRLSEMANPDSYPNPLRPQMDIRGETRAFCLRDLEFADSTRGRYSAEDLLELSPGHIPARVWITFRTQKNGEHGERRMFTANTSNPSGFCFVSAIVRVVHRFNRLRLHLPGDTSHVPLSIYLEPNSTGVRSITSNAIEFTMRSIAATVYKLDAVKDATHLQRWSAHSLRVGACTTLHGMGYAASEIKFLLRWKSDTYMMYLRNLAITADKHNATLDAAGAMPNFL